MHMNKSLLAVTTAALLLGSISAASAQSAYSQPPYGDDASYGYSDRYDPNYDARYDSRDNGRYDERSDSRYDNRYDNRYDDRYDNRYSGRDDRYDRYGDNGNLHDRDCDGISDRYDRNDSRSVNDRDCDGISNRFDRRDGRHHNARRSYAVSSYHAPSGYRYARYQYGSRLPRNYWGNNYYIDYRPYGLAPPPSGYQWNRVGNDAYMISMQNGMVAEAIYSLFR
jgi:Ni/Co efflux regulator RcnB